MNSDHLNIVRLQRALLHLQNGLAPFVQEKLLRHFGDDWRSRARGVDAGRTGNSLDAYALLKTMIDHWSTVFAPTFEYGQRHTVRSFVTLALEGRNHTAHAIGDVDDAAALRYLDAMLELLRAAGAPADATAAIQQLYDQQRRPVSLPSPVAPAVVRSRLPREGTIAERLLAYVRDHPDLDDDELSLRLDVRPRQTINMAARRLEAEGKLIRFVGPRGKIINRPRGGSL